MPTPTDLVTDLPADFEVFGQAVDTDFVDLLGGTTGQVLSKASSTDMDFTWSAAGMTNPMTTTGDTIHSSSGSTPARLGIGTTGQVLTVAGGVPSWATAASGSMTQIGSTTTLAGTSTTISFSSSGYKSLYITVNDVESSGTVKMDFNVNGVSNLIDYCSLRFYQGGTVNTGQADTYLKLIEDNKSSASTPNAFQITIANVDAALNKTLIAASGYQDDSSRRSVQHFAGLIKTTDAISSITFTAQTNSYTGGTVRIYGVN